jgi:two-component system response regulator (stage 0 sporulation protein F)
MKKVLVVDDDKDVRDFLIELVQSLLGYEVEGVRNLSEAITKIRANPIDFVMLDVNLSDAQRCEGLKRIMAMDRGMKVLMVSCDTDESLERESKSLGAIGYITKPFDVGQLMQILEEAMGKLI